VLANGRRCGRFSEYIEHPEAAYASRVMRGSLEEGSAQRKAADSGDLPLCQAASRSRRRPLTRRLVRFWLCVS
jgi:hypothetical protein